MSEIPKISAVASRTRAKVIAATVDLIYEVGIVGVSHRKIAERAGVPLGTTTYHFDSLTQLIELAIRQELELDSKRRKALLSRPVGNDGLAGLFLELMLPSGQSENDDLATAYARLSEIQFNPSLKHLVTEHQELLESDISDLLRNAGLEPKMGSLVLALLDGFLLQWLIYEKPYSWLKTQVSKALRTLGVGS